MYSLFGHPRFFKFKWKYQQYGPSCFQSLFPLLRLWPYVVSLSNMKVMIELIYHPFSIWFHKKKIMNICLIFLLKLNAFSCRVCVIVNIYSILLLSHYLAVVFKSFSWTWVKTTLLNNIEKYVKNSYGRVKIWVKEQVIDLLQVFFTHFVDAKLLHGFSLTRTLICSSKMYEKHLWKSGILSKVTGRWLARFLKISPCESMQPLWSIVKVFVLFIRLCDTS